MFMFIYVYTYVCIYVGMAVIFDVASKSLWDSVEKLAKLPDSFKNEFCGDITKDTLVPDRFPVSAAVPTALPSMGKSEGFSLRNGDMMISTLIMVVIYSLL
jgi:hypothetical protein